MAQVLQQNFGARSDTEAECAAVRSLSPSLAHLLSVLSKVIPCDLTSYNEITSTKLRIMWRKRRPGAVPIDSMHIYEHSLDVSPALAHHPHTDHDCVLGFTDALAWSQFRRIRAFNEFYRLQGVRHQMLVTLPSPAPGVIGIAANRSQPDFSDRDRLLLKLVRPHLVQAYRNAKAVSPPHQEQARVGQAVDPVGPEIMVLTRQAEVRSASEGAWRWLEEYFTGEPLEPNRLPSVLAIWVRHDQTSQQEHRQGPQAHEEIGEFHAGGLNGRRLVLRLSGKQDELLLVLHEERHSSSEVDFHAAFQQKFGLTPREAEVLTWVGHGKTNPEIGTILMISPRTVAKHLERVYQQLGVDTRAGAIGQVLMLSSAVRLPSEDRSSPAMS
jgi:DNA-binding CsgD family transcriptional regulator